MSTALLYHGWDIRGYTFQSSDFTDDQIIFTLAQDEPLRCAACSSDQVVRRGKSVRHFKSLPIGKKSVTLVLPVQRVHCRNCDRLGQVRITFADPRHGCTHAFERYALQLSQLTTVKDAAVHLGVSWDLVKEIQKRHLKKHFGSPPLKDLRLLAVDEICIGRGYRFLTLVLDQESGAVVFVGEGKGAEALEPFWGRLKVAGARIEAVAMDMSVAYIAAITAHLPEAAIVFDHFHVIKHFNEKLSDLRRDLHRQTTETQHKDVLKGTRWLLLKNPENLDESKNERDRLEEALRINKPLATAYYMKEELRLFWAQPDKAAAQAFLKDWIIRARESGIAMLRKFSNMLAGKRSGLLAYYDFKISSGPLEGTNNKIRVLQRQAYGFRDLEFFKLKIYALHQMKYALIG